MSVTQPVYGVNFIECQQKNHSQISPDCEQSAENYLPLNIIPSPTVL